MSEKENKTPAAPVEKVPFEAPQFTNEQLLAMVLDTQKQLAEAIKNIGKPYVDPVVAKAKQDALEERKKAIQIELRKRQLTKKACLHLRTNSDGTWDEKARMNIKWQEHSNGIIKGVCGTCGSEFDTRNPEDLALLRKDGRAIRLMGRARENTRLM